MLFPDGYRKPVLQSIVEAAENGWNAVCATGGSATSGFGDCRNGDVASGSKDGFNGVIYTHSNKSNHLLDPEDVGEGL